MKSIKILFLGLAILAGQIGCKKFIEVDAPVTSVNAGNIYNDNSTAISVVTGVMAKANSNFSASGVTQISILTDLSADNLTLFNPAVDLYTQTYRNALTSTIFPSNSFWRSLYSNIYTCNAALEGLSRSKTLTDAIKKRLLGEVYFFRAFHYFYLVNLYGDAPLIVSTNHEISNITPRNSVAKVYEQIIADLNQAKDLLDERYLAGDLITSSNDRVRPNRSAVYALLARVELYRKNYAAAEAAATNVLSQSTLYSTANVSLDKVFLKNSLETIWALMPVRNGFSTEEGNLLILPAKGPDNNTRRLYASEQLIKSFDASDQRKTVWISSVTSNGKEYPFVRKYRAIQAATGTTPVEYPIVLRLAEQYLIRAEARAQQNQLSIAIQDVDIVRKRAGLVPIAEINPGIGKDDLINLIFKERRAELFTEWGHRWFDLRRSGQIDAVMTDVTQKKGGTWASFQALYPIPSGELLLSNILTQNPGYNP